MKITRLMIALFIVVLVVSGLTAFPLQIELNFLLRNFSFMEPLQSWLYSVHSGIMYNAKEYPFIQYGSDWLAFAHIIIALPFLKLYQKPSENLWIVNWGLLACLGIFLFVPIAGFVREIPLFWQLIDVSFGFFGGLWLLIIKNRIMKHEYNSEFLS